MPRFVHRTLPLLVSTNFKVLYSTLQAQPALEEVTEARFARHVLSPGRRHVMFARNPYTRIQSVFDNKFRRSPAALGTADFRPWQRIQIRYLGLTGFHCANANDGAIRDALLAVRFDDFVNDLPRFWYRDAHLVPQYHRTRITLRWIVPLAPARVDRLIRIEEMDPEAMSESLGLDLVGIRKNAARGEFQDSDFTPPLERVVQRVYRGDFERLGYTA